MFRSLSKRFSKEISFFTYIFDYASATQEESSSMVKQLAEILRELVPFHPSSLPHSALASSEGWNPHDCRDFQENRSNELTEEALLPRRSLQGGLGDSRTASPLWFQGSSERSKASWFLETVCLHWHCPILDSTCQECLGHRIMRFVVDLEGGKACGGISISFQCERN